MVAYFFGGDWQEGIWGDLLQLRNSVSFLKIQ